MSGSFDCADRIRAGLEAKGLTIVATAARLGIAHQALSQVLTGHRPGRKHLASLAEMLDTTVQWLVSGSGEPPPWHVPAVDALVRQAQRLSTLQLGEFLSRLQAHAPADAAVEGARPRLQEELAGIRDALQRIEARLERIEQAGPRGRPGDPHQPQ